MRKTTLHCTIVNKDPNKIKYKGRRGATLGVIDNSGNVLATFQWKQKTFKVDDHTIGSLEFEKMNFMLNHGWMRVCRDIAGKWELTSVGDAVVTRDGKISYKV